MLEKILKFAQKVSEVFPEIPVDALLEMWKEIDDPEPIVEAEEIPTCKHMFLKGRNANTQCKWKVKGGGEYCSYHKN